MKFRYVYVVLIVLALCTAVSAQVRLHGRVYGETFPGSEKDFPFKAIYCYAALDGSECEPLQFATWEIDPVAWYSMTGPAGRYTMVFTRPNRFMRPIVLSNIFTKPGDDIHRIVRPKFDYANFFDGDWDKKPASDYYQTFVATGASLTHVGIRPVHDGVDGGGPGAQNIVVTIHKRTAGTPDKWPQVGPSRTIKDVDCGGPKDYVYYAGWNSGEVPLVPGQTYAVHLKGEKPFQMFQQPNDDKKTDCYRIAADKTGWQGADIWMAVGTDNDGLVIPYNKCSNKEYVEFAGGSTKWTQTYVAQGTSLAAALLSGAVGTAHPPLSRTRLKVRVRKGGPNGPIVGVEKIAIGSGNYTGDASWGWFCAAYSPGEVPLEPGKTYAIEWETMETVQSLHDYINCKNVKSDLKPGFNPYKKDAPDEYKLGTSYKDGVTKQDFDLDMQIIEYQNSPKDWDKAVDQKNLIRNGDMATGEVSGGPGDSGRPTSWKSWATGSATSTIYMTDNVDSPNRLLRVTGHPKDSNIVDGGFVQKVEGLDHLETYRLSGKARSTWQTSNNHAVLIGYDPTGQDTDPNAATIVWLPIVGTHDVWVNFTSEPIRPVNDSISIWLRGKSTAPEAFVFEADFDDFRLNRVKLGVPGKI